MAIAANTPPPTPDSASAPTWSDWLVPSAPPCSSAGAASEMIAAAAGRQIAMANAVTPRVGHRAPCESGITIVAIATPRTSAARASI